MEGRRKVSIVVPFFGEEGTVDAFFEELYTTLAATTDLDWQVVAVDDGSADRTFELLKAQAERRESLCVLRLSRNFGHQYALLAGIDHATGDAVVTIDSDLQDPPSVIPRLVEAWRQGSDVVHAVRASRAGEPLLRLLLIRCFYRILRWISRVPVPENAGDLRLMSRRAVDSFRQMGDATPYLRGLAVWVGFRQTSISYDRRPRAAGRSKYGIAKLVRLAWDGLTGLSYVPLRLATGLGILFSMGAFLLGAFLVVEKFIHDRTPAGWRSLAVLILLVGGVQLVVLGILGEYLGRVFEQSRRRPLYVVSDKIRLP